jgi:hypothetical protein
MRELDISKSHGESPRLYGGQSNTLQHMECSDLDRVSHVGMGVVQHSTVILLMTMPICYILMVVQRSLRVPQWHFMLLVMSDSFHAQAPKSNILESYSFVRAAVGPTASQLVLCRGDTLFVVSKGCLPV